MDIKEFVKVVLKQFAGEMITPLMIQRAITTLYVSAAVVMVVFLTKVFVVPENDKEPKGLASIGREIRERTERYEDPHKQGLMGFARSRSIQDVEAIIERYKSVVEAGVGDAHTPKILFAAEKLKDLLIAPEEAEHGLGIGEIITDGKKPIVRDLDEEGPFK